MGLLSFLQRNTDPAAAKAPAAAAPDAVAAARTRARRRLIGAAVLLGVGVIGFPLLFETQPRPIPVNIPIEIPRRDALPPLVLPPQAAASAKPADEPPSQPRTAAVVPAEIVERAPEPVRDAPAPAAVPAPVATPPAPAVAAKAAPPAEPPKRSDDGARARALLEGRAGAKAEPKPAPKAAAEAGVRLVVQVGAYTEAAKVREARQKLEKLGFKTYTQVVDAGGSKHTRVRVGPFDSRSAAEQAAARIKASGLPVAVLTL